MNEKSLWEIYEEKQLQEMETVTERYKGCIDIGKTERECVRLSIKMAEEAGYRHLKDFAAEGKTLNPGDKVYAVYNEKTLALYHIGEEPLEHGMNILGAHIDSPRIDIKQNPLYEKDGLAYLDTHYYGGIKKYQWVTIPLAIHGVIVKKDGSREVVNIGEDDKDPVFTITDILVHLSKKQMEKKAGVVIEGENLDLLIGSVPLADEEKDAVKANMLKLLEEKYHMTEDDFLSAELEIVPVGKARDLGFDRSMILAYGQDDRICAFTSLMAILEMEETPKRTSCCILVDKEEIGSYGASGMQSRFFENATAEVSSSAATLRIFPCAAVCRTPRCCLPMSVRLMIRSMQMFSRRRTLPFSARAWCSTSTLVQVEREVPATPMRNIWLRFERSWTTQASCFRRQSWAKSMPAAAERSPGSWQITAWKSSTAVWLFCVCTHRWRCPAKRISMKPCEVIKHF